jgi:hypothetical protein
MLNCINLRNIFTNVEQFYSFSAPLSVNSSISSFNVIVTSTNGQTETFDNNGVGFPVQDSVILQSSQSCVGATADPNGQNVTLSAAVRYSSFRQHQCSEY